MSMIRPDGRKVLLPRSDRNRLWGVVRDYYAGSDARTWRNLAMLVLHEHGGWNLENIGLAFGHSKGHVSRCIHRIKRDMRDRFTPNRSAEQTPDQSLDESENCESEVR